MIEALRKAGENGTHWSLAFLDNASFAPPSGTRGLLDFQLSLMARIDNIRDQAHLPPD